MNFSEHYLAFSRRALLMMGFAAALLSASCSNTGADQSADSRTRSDPGAVADIPYGQIDARFVPGRDRGLIQITTRDSVAITSAVLVMPDGSRTAARSLDSQEDPATSGSGGPRLLSAPGYSLSNPVMHQPIQGFPETTTVGIGQILSAAEIRLPNIPVYDRDWRRAHIEITEGEGMALRRTDIPAPEPKP